MTYTPGCEYLANVAATYYEATDGPTKLSSMAYSSATTTTAASSTKKTTSAAVANGTKSVSTVATIIMII